MRDDFTFHAEKQQAYRLVEETWSEVWTLKLHSCTSDKQVSPCGRASTTTPCLHRQHWRERDKKMYDVALQVKKRLFTGSGATAFESQGPHIPDGMLQRLNAVVQRTSRRSHHDGFGIESNGDGTSDSSTSTNRRSSNPLFDAETLRTPISGREPDFDGSNRPRWRRSSTEQYEDHHPADDVHGSALGAFSSGHGER